MPQRREINIYCDESCHLERDKHASMVLGAVWCPADKSSEIAKRLRGIKALHGLHPSTEAKWTKVSPSKVKFYLALVNCFFAESDLRFRAIVIPDKSKLQHDKFNQTHNDWYYKMYFDMLKVLLTQDECYNIYVDIKDTRGASKVRDLRDVLCNETYDFDKQIIRKIQLVRSHEIQQMQLADLLIGCVSFVNRGRMAVSESTAKREVAKRFQVSSGYDLTRTTLLREQKVNIFKWHARDEP